MQAHWYQHNMSDKVEASSPDQAEQWLHNMCIWAKEDFRPDSTLNFDTTALYGLRDIQASKGRIQATLPVTKRVQNRYGTQVH